MFYQQTNDDVHQSHGVPINNYCNCNTRSLDAHRRRCLENTGYLRLHSHKCFENTECLGLHSTVDKNPSGAIDTKINSRCVDMPSSRCTSRAVLQPPKQVSLSRTRVRSSHSGTWNAPRLRKHFTYGVYHTRNKIQSTAQGSEARTRRHTVWFQRVWYFQKHSHNKLMPEHELTPYEGSFLKDNNPPWRKLKHILHAGDYCSRVPSRSHPYGDRPSGARCGWACRVYDVVIQLANETFSTFTKNKYYSVT